MAVDSSCIDGDTHVGGHKKIWRVGKCLIGFCGEITGALGFVNWYKNGADCDETYPWGSQFEALVVCPDGSMKMYDGHSQIPIQLSKREKYIALGSGLDVALGCMYMGGTAVDAIKVAVKHNVNTKGPVRSYKMKG